MAINVRIAHPLTFDGVDYRPNDIASVTTEDAARLVAAGYAVLVDDPVVPVTYPDPLPQYVLDTDLTAAIAALSATFVPFKSLARNPDLLIKGAVTRDANGAATSAPVEWPDGTSGTYTATTVSTAFPGAVDAYTITYGSPVTKTYTQPAITRDASTGAATNVPAITVA